METLKNLNKLWRTSLLLPPSTTTYSDAAASDIVNNNKEVLGDDDEEKEIVEEDESFFELELVMLNGKTRDKESEINNDNFCTRVVPVEPPRPRPHSPASFMKSAPKFKVSLFRKHQNVNSDISDLKLKQIPEFACEEKVAAATISTLIRESSSPVSKQSMSKCKTEDGNDDSVSIGSSSSSKRFSKDVMHKYLKLKLIKPFHLRVAKRCASVNNNKSSRLFEVKDCSSSPAPSLSGYGYGFRVVCKQLGKSRSASSMMVGSRRDESLLMVEHDDGGIQSAILHCKSSFHSSRDSSVYSRSSSDSNSNSNSNSTESKNSSAATADSDL